MCRIRVLERLRPGPVARVKCERTGQRLLAHRRTESGTRHAWLLILLPQSAGGAARALPSPAHLLPPPTLPQWPGSSTSPAPTQATLLVVSVTAQDPKIAPGWDRDSPTGEL